MNKKIAAVVIIAVVAGVLFYISTPKVKVYQVANAEPRQLVNTDDSSNYV